MLCKVYLFTASNNNSSYLGIIVHLIESCDQLVHKTSTEGVEGLGTVQCDQSNTTIGTWGGNMTIWRRWWRLVRYEGTCRVDFNVLKLLLTRHHPHCRHLTVEQWRHLETPHHGQGSHHLQHVHTGHLNVLGLQSQYNLELRGKKNNLSWSR